jgi:hypothetical protein
MTFLSSMRKFKPRRRKTPPPAPPRAVAAADHACMRVPA